MKFLRSRGRDEFRRRRRRRKSLPPPPAEFWSARRRASRIWFAPAGKVAAARLRGLKLPPDLENCGERTHRRARTDSDNSEAARASHTTMNDRRRHGGAIGGGGQGGHGPSNNLVGGGHTVFAPPQYFALEFKILTLNLMQREENMFRVPLCWMCVHCKIHYTY